MIRDLSSGDLTGDAQRMHCALEHCRGVVAGILSIHAVAMARGGRGVLLFGGHGAGKSVTGLALAARGWRALAGDVALVQVGGHTERLMLVGGTRRFLLRPNCSAVHEVRHSVPSCEPASYLAGRVDVTGFVPWVALGADEIPVCLAANVVVDSGAGLPPTLSVLDEHTSQSVWWRASGHLLDRVIDDPFVEPLRTMECPELSAARMDLVRRAARVSPVHEVLGTADGITAAIELELMETCI